MNHLLAVLGLAVACALWAVLQPREPGDVADACEENGSDCERCALASAGCSTSSATGRRLG